MHRVFISSSIAEQRWSTNDASLFSGIGGFDLAAAWAGWTIKAYGNAIVPQVALRIFETINEYERCRK